MSTTMKASVHLGPSYNENLAAYRNTNFNELRALFDITHRLILEQTFETLDVCTMMWHFTLWMRSTLCHDQVIKWATAKGYVKSGSVLCLGRMYDHTPANAKWKGQLEDFHQTLSENYLESMENQFSSSALIHQSVHHWRFFKRSKTI